MKRRKSARRALTGLRGLQVSATLEPSPDDTRETRRRKHRALYALYVTSAMVMGVAALAIYVFPTQTWLRQRRATAEISNKLNVIDAQTAQLGQEVRKLDTNAEIQRVARERFGLVFPGEKAFSVLPASVPEFPPQWPYNLVKGFFVITGK